MLSVSVASGCEERTDCTIFFAASSAKPSAESASIASRRTCLSPFPASAVRQSLYRVDLVAQLYDYPLGRLLADALDGRKALCVAVRDAQLDLANRKAGYHRKRDLRADARDRHEQRKEVALRLGRESVEKLRVLAHLVVRKELRLAAGGGKALVRRQRDESLVPNAPAFDHRPSGGLLSQYAVEKNYHAADCTTLPRRSQAICGKLNINDACSGT